MELFEIAPPDMEECREIRQVEAVGRQRIRASATFGRQHLEKQLDQAPVGF